MGQVLTSQGIVSSVEPGWLKLQIDIKKFPGIENIFNNRSISGVIKHMYLYFLTLDLSGRYLRKYEIINGDCQLFEDNNRVTKIFAFALYRFTNNNF